MSATERGARAEYAWCAGVTVLCAALIWPLLRIGWVPADEGTLAASAARVLSGQWPHRDYAEIYTGGLSFWHALWMHVLGLNLFSMRVACFAAFVLWVPAIYAIARQFVAPMWAAVVVLTAVGWSYPNYVASMPSWYNLFFATWGSLAILQFIERRRAGWLVLAGACAGASVLVKVTGLYFLAALLLFCALAEQENAQSKERGSGYRLLCGTGLAAFAAGVAQMLRPHLHSGEFVVFLLPCWICAGLWLARERASGGPSLQRLVRLLRLVVPVLCGFVAIAGAWVLLYAAHGAACALLRGVFGSAGARIQELTGRIVEPGAQYVLYALLPFGLLIAAVYVRVRGWTVLLAAFLLAAVTIACALLPGLQDPWMMFGMAAPLVIAWGAERVLHNHGERIGRERVMLLCAVAAVCSLVQFPVSYVTYFCYVAPLVLLAALSVVRLSPAESPALLLVVLVWAAIFGWTALVPKHVYDPGLRYAGLRPLQLERGRGLLVPEQASTYEELIPLLRAHSPNGLLYAGNDCPQMYFLSGLRNPAHDDTEPSAGEIEQALERGDLHVAVLSDAPFFASSRVPDDLRAKIAARLPQHQVVGTFSVYWDR